MSFNSSNRWAIRGFRLWFALLVPVVVLFGFHLFSSALEIAEGMREVQAWIEVEREREVKGLRGPVTKTDVQFKMLDRDYGRLAERKNISAAALLFALVIPGAFILVSRLVRWIWNTNSQVDPRLAASPDELTTLVKYRSVYFKSAGISGVLLLAFYLSPERAAQTAISGGIQALGLALIAWVIIRLRR